MLPQLLTGHEVLHGRLQIVPLAVESTDADVHVRRSAQHRTTLLRRKLQCLLVGAHGLTEATLRTAYIGQCESAAERVRPVPGVEKARAGSRIRLMCGLEISARPPCQAKQRSGTPASEMVVLRYEVECAACMLLGQSEVP